MWKGSFSCEIRREPGHPGVTHQKCARGEFDPQCCMHARFQKRGPRTYPRGTPYSTCFHTSAISRAILTRIRNVPYCTYAMAQYKVQVLVVIGSGGLPIVFENRSAKLPDAHKYLLIKYRVLVRPYVIALLLLLTFIYFKYCYIYVYNNCIKLYMNYLSYRYYITIQFCKQHGYKYKQ